jgi:hypothetical protein
MLCNNLLAALVFCSAEVLDLKKLSCADRVIICYIRVFSIIAGESMIQIL